MKQRYCVDCGVPIRGNARRCAYHQKLHRQHVKSRSYFRGERDCGDVRHKQPASPPLVNGEVLAMYDGVAFLRNDDDSLAFVPRSRRPDYLRIGRVYRLHQQPTPDGGARFEVLGEAR